MYLFSKFTSRRQERAHVATGAQAEQASRSGEEEEHEEWNEEAGPVGDGKIMHLGSDLPDPPGSEDSDDVDVCQNIEISASHTVGNSTISVNAPNRQNRQATQTGAQKLVTGRLKRPSMSNPAYKNPMQQRRLRNLGPARERPDSVYDEIDHDDDPAARLPARSALRKARPQFSPTKAQRKNAVKQASATASAATSSQRRSTWVVVEEDDGERREVTSREDRNDYQDVLSPISALPVAEVQIDVEQDAGAEQEDEAEMPVGEALPSSSRERRATGPQKKQYITEVDKLRRDASDVIISPERTRSGRPNQLSSPKAARSVETRRTEKLSLSPTAVKARALRSSQGPSAAEKLQDLRRRRSQAKAEEDSQEQTPGEGAGQAASQSLQAIDDNIVVQQLQPADADDAENPEEDAVEATNAQAPPVTASRRLKRTAAAPATANTSSKRARSAPAQTDQDEDARDLDEQDSTGRTRLRREPVDANKMFGQWLQLRKIFKAVKHIGCNVKAGTRLSPNKFDLDDKLVEKAVSHCCTLRELYNTLAIHDGPVEPGMDPASNLADLKQHIADLAGSRDAEIVFEKNNVDRCTNIYSHLVREMVYLIRAAIACYTERDKERVYVGQMTISHLRIVVHLMDLLLELIEGASQYDRPHSSDHLVRPVRNGINAPLKKVRAALDLRIRYHEQNFAAKAQRDGAARQRASAVQQDKRLLYEERAQLATQRAARREAEQRWQRQQAEIERAREKWLLLHTVRRFVEDDWKLSRAESVRKKEHLLPPVFDYDMDGNQFLREDVFDRRVGPTADQVKRAREVIWTVAEKAALMDGLQRFAGPKVFEKIFAEYCGDMIKKQRPDFVPGTNELARFNVTEIATMAAMMREQFIQYRQSTGHEVEQWILDIPDWTTRRVGIGKENVVEEEVEADEAGEEKGQGAAEDDDEREALFA